MGKDDRIIEPRGMGHSTDDDDDITHLLLANVML